MTNVEAAIEKRLPNAEVFEIYRSKKERRDRIDIKNDVVYDVLIAIGNREKKVEIRR